MHFRDCLQHAWYVYYSERQGQNQGFPLFFGKGLLESGCT